MKKHIAIFGTAILLLILGSCHHDNGNSSGHNRAYLSMQVNGTDWVSTDSAAIAWVNLSHWLNVIGKKGDTQHTLAISIPNVTSTGTFNLTDSATSFDFYFGMASDSFYNIGYIYPGTSGTLTIDTIFTGSSAIKYCSGTFSGVAKCTYTGQYLTITNGKFHGAP
jgi:hypothetical protein